MWQRYGDNRTNATLRRLSGRRSRWLRATGGTKRAGASDGAALMPPGQDLDGRKTHTREWSLPSSGLAPYIAAMREHATTPNGVLGSKLTDRYVELVRSATGGRCGPR